MTTAPYWKVPTSQLPVKEAQQRMYALTDASDKLRKQIAGLNSQLDGLSNEKLSLLKAHPTLRFRRPEL